MDVRLAGNVNLNYSDGAPFVAWLIYSSFCVVLPLVLIAGWAAVRLLIRLRGRFRSP